ncbi:hypothetical protein MFLO_10985 [Listeria floridensis FSL S10-1187]|uniref:Uncharacterized protein n=1 Tax=Listeria floridensis FSL S10-1187 TaxID=1265817 RepID=A0ABP3AWP7_9LIST|nr:hypothetical protein [Listeria floridensis]EUJ29714.1 hypothetical protein MFLO_10985 [Listeria floridensis FSL S10-1187]
MILGHVKWFTEAAPHRNACLEVLTMKNAGLFALSAIFIFILYVSAPKLAHSNFNSRLQKVDSSLFFRWGVVFALVISTWSGHVLIPELKLTSFTLAIITVSCVCLLINRKLTGWISVCGLSILMAIMFVQLGVHHAFDYLFFIGIIITLIGVLLQNTLLSVRPLEILTGASILWVGMEKVIFSNMSLDIVNRYHLFTFGFSKDSFVMCAALVELVVGFVMVTGYFRHIIALALTLLFFSDQFHLRG